MTIYYINNYHNPQTFTLIIVYLAQKLAMSVFIVDS